MWTWCIISCQCESTAKEVSYEWSQFRVSSTDSKLHELPYISPQLTLVVLQEGKAAGNTKRKNKQRTRSKEAPRAIGLLALVFTILRQNLRGSNKNEWNLIIRLRQIFYCLLQQLYMFFFFFFYREIRDLEEVTSWKRSIGKRYFLLCGLPDKRCWKRTEKGDTKGSIIILQLIFINKFCCSNPQSSVLWSQLASYLLQACPDELQVYYHWCLLFFLLFFIYFERTRTKF